MSGISEVTRMRVPHRFRKTITVAATALAVLVAGAGVAYAVNENSLTQGNTDHTIYKFGRTITVTGHVNGDIFCAGQTVTIDAEVNGDVLCAGQTVTIHGTVHGNVRAAGQTVTLDATVGNNASLAGQDVTVPENTQIGRDVSAAGQTLTLAGGIGRDLDASGNTLTLNGLIGRNVSVHVGDKVDLQHGAQIKGSLTYTAPHHLSQAAKAQVSGTVAYHQAVHHRPGHAGWPALWRVYGLVAMGVLALVLVALFPQLIRRWNNLAVTGFGWALLTGFVAMFAVPIIIIITFVTFVGAPLGILLLLLWIVAAMLSAPIAMYFVGSRIAPKLHPLLIMLVGVAVVGVVELFPYFGPLLGLLSYWLGTGVLLLNLKRIYQKPNYARK